MAAGLVDRVQLTIFPMITGQTGQGPIFQGAADFDLELIESRTLDGHIQELTYRYDFSFKGTDLSRAEDAESGAIAHVAGQPFHDLFCAGQRDGSIDPTLPTDETYVALVTSMTGTSQRLLIEQQWTSGSDRRPRDVHDTLIHIWRQALTPKEAP